MLIRHHTFINCPILFYISIFLGNSSSSNYFVFFHYYLYFYPNEKRNLNSIVYLWTININKHQIKTSSLYLRTKIVTHFLISLPLRCYPWNDSPLNYVANITLISANVLFQVPTFNKYNLNRLVRLSKITILPNKNLNWFTNQYSRQI